MVPWTKVHPLLGWIFLFTKGVGITERKVIIIDPNDKSLNDIFNFNLDSKQYHMNVASIYACSKKIPNVTEGYNDLASNNYVVIFSVDNIIEVYTGVIITDNQANLLKEVINTIFSKYENLTIELGVLENNNFKLLHGGFTSVDELLEYRNNNLQGDDLNVRKKI